MTTRLTFATGPALFLALAIGMFSPALANDKKCPCLSGIRTLDSIWTAYTTAQADYLTDVIGLASVSYEDTNRCQSDVSDRTPGQTDQFVVMQYQQVNVNQDGTTLTHNDQLSLLALYNTLDTETMFCRTILLQYDAGNQTLDNNEERLYLTQDEFNDCETVVTDKKLPVCPDLPE